ncbi:MAG: zinc ribbon domain-containing protein [Acutalibacteraceae bacterium]
MKICKNCNFENSDEAVFCSKCGSRFETEAAGEETNANGFSGADNNAYAQGEYRQYSYQNTGYGQNAYDRYQPAPTPSVTKGKVTAALVVSIFFGGIVGMIFAILAFVAYGDYDTAIIHSDMLTARDKCEKIKMYNKIAWIFNIIGIVCSALAVIAFIAFFALGFMTVLGGEMLDEFDLAYTCLISML